MDAYEEIVEDVTQGNSEFFSIGRCYFVTFAQGSELVIQCAEGRGLAQSALILKELATKAGYKTVRIHVFNQGIRRILHKLLFEQAETIYRLKLNGQ